MHAQRKQTSAIAGKHHEKLRKLKAMQSMLLELDADANALGLKFERYLIAMVGHQLASHFGDTPPNAMERTRTADKKMAESKAQVLV